MLHTFRVAHWVFLPSCKYACVVRRLRCAGGKRSGADYSAEATAVREMYEETAGALSFHGMRPSPI